MKKLITTAICIMLATGMAAQISIIGPATPANDWQTDFFLTQNPENTDLWTLIIELTDEMIKFRENADWINNWGGNSFPSGYGVLNGDNIPVTSSGTYFITFNTATLFYNFRLLSVFDMGISHQAVIRNAANELITNQTIGVKVSILQSSATGPVVYSETHSPVSNANGLISFVIGRGDIASGDYFEIDWADGPYFIKTEADPQGGSNYSIAGTSQILIVPYAIHAATSADNYWGKSDNDIFYQNGKVGIGTSEPTALLHTSGTGQGEGNVLFTGSRKESGWGDPPAENFGTRLMWYPDKAAFRVGHVWNQNWNRDSIGSFSVGMGVGSKAWGAVSTALGLESSAGNYSTAMGWNTNASGNSSTAMGRGTIASGNYSTAMGQNTRASGDHTTAMGYQTIASGRFSTAMGLGTKALSAYETVIGRWNAEYSPLDSLGWNDNDRLFVIGRGTSNENRANAITVLKNGYTGFGVNHPFSFITLNGNDHRQIGMSMRSTSGSGYNLNLAAGQAGPGSDHNGGDLHLLSGASTGTGVSNIYFHTASPGPSGSSTNNMTIKMRITGEGDVGIGTTSPTQKLDVNGQLRIRGGNPDEGKVLTSDENGTASWQPSSISLLSCIDIDGNAYPTIVIGNQIWMADNLRVTKYSNGEPILLVTSHASWASLIVGGYCWYNNNQTENAKYGAMYNWHAVNDPRGLCPEGWRVPTDEEWTTFTNLLGGQAVAGGKLKATSSLWDHSNNDATNSTGFSALPGGRRLSGGSFEYLGFLGGYWTATQESSSHAWYRYMYYWHGEVGCTSTLKTLGKSVRCIRD